MVRPIYFYTFMEKGDFKDKSLTFALISSWILSFFIAAVLFYTQIMDIIVYRFLEGIFGLKLLFVFPVLVIFAAVFFIIFYILIGGFAALAFISGFSISAFLLVLSARLFGGKGDYKEIIKGSYYSIAAYMGFILIPAMAFLSKFKLLSFNDFITGSNILMFAMSIYLWGLWSILIRKAFHLSKTKAVFGSLIVVLLVIILQMFVGIKILPRLGGLIQ